MNVQANPRDQLMQTIIIQRPMSESMTVIASVMSFSTVFFSTIDDYLTATHTPRTIYAPTQHGPRFPGLGTRSIVEATWDIDAELPILFYRARTC